MISTFIGGKRWGWKVWRTIPVRTDHPFPSARSLPQCHSCLFRRCDSESVLGRTKSGRVTLSSKRVRANANVAKLCRGSECCRSVWWTGSRSFLLAALLSLCVLSRDLNWLLTLTFSERQHKIQTAMKSSDSDLLLFFLYVGLIRFNKKTNDCFVHPQVTGR